MIETPNALAGDAEWHDWTMEQLVRVNAGKENEWLAKLVDDNIKSDTASRLMAIARQLRRVFPTSPQTLPNGKTWQGSNLSKGILEASLERGQDNATGLAGNLLDMAAATPETPKGLFRWLVASGFDPLKFNPHTQNTFLGGSAYRGRADIVRMLAGAGFNLGLRLEPQHLTNPREQAGLVGTTLLHRVVSRSHQMGPSLANDVILALMQGGLDPLEANAGGQTPLSLARDETKEVIEHWIAEQDLKRMSRQTRKAKGARHPTRL